MRNRLGSRVPFTQEPCHQVKRAQKDVKCFHQEQLP